MADQKKKLAEVEARLAEVEAALYRARRLMKNGTFLLTRDAHHRNDGLSLMATIDGLFSKTASDPYEEKQLELGNGVG